tara:strand:- start:1244 stop:2401 length:1158 start_codon:yes stop_codon:yes gene_type:complete
VIPYGKQDITEADIKSVLKVLHSDFLTQGPQVPLFENAISNYCCAEYSVAVNSATSALHIACMALGISKGDIVWTSPNSFVASANCAIYCGAKINFVDIDPQTYNLSVYELERKLIQAKKENKLPKLLIPVHFAGQPCDMKQIYSLGQEYGFKIIEDASHAIGARYMNNQVGSCKYSDITVFSFHPVKIITTAEGGIATTKSKKLANKMKLLRSHGVTRDKGLMSGDSDGDWYYQQVDLGFNYRMTELQAALGSSQLNRVERFISNRKKIKDRYDLLLNDLPIVKPYQNQNCYSSFHLYPIQIDSKFVTKSRKKIFDALRSRGIGVNVHYIPIHMQPYYSMLGFKAGDFPNAEAFYEKAISIPIFQSMTLVQQDEVISSIKAVLE